MHTIANARCGVVGVRLIQRASDYVLIFDQSDVAAIDIIRTWTRREAIRQFDRAVALIATTLSGEAA